MLVMKEYSTYQVAMHFVRSSECSDFLNTLPVFPNPLLSLTILVESALAVLLAIDPASLVLVPVWPAPNQQLDNAPLQIVSRHLCNSNRWVKTYQ